MRTPFAAALSATITVTLALGLAACSSDPGATSDAALNTSQEVSVGSCDPNALIAAAPAGRRAILDRAMVWVNEGVPYSQSAYHDGYRQDCSGFVSMCWELGTSHVTWTLAPFDNGDSHEISEGEMLPGDAFNSRDHVMLFAGWLDDAHSQACIIQENHTGTPANVRAYGRGWFGQFTPIRWNGADAVGDNGCTGDQTNNCGAFGCACVDGQCNGGFCPGTGCTDQQTANCAAYGTACVDGKCSGGFTDGSGCTAKETNDCASVGTACVDHKCAGGFGDGSGCTAKETNDCAQFGCLCVDGKCGGGFCGGSGCTAKETVACQKQGFTCNGGTCK